MYSRLEFPFLCNSESQTSVKQYKIPNTKGELLVGSAVMWCNSGGGSHDTRCSLSMCWSHCVSTVQSPGAPRTPGQVHVTRSHSQRFQCQSSSMISVLLLSNHLYCWYLTNSLIFEPNVLGETDLYKSSQNPHRVKKNILNQSSFLCQNFNDW